MICERCGGKTLVKDTRHDAARNECYRQKICERCGKTFYTIEFVIDENDEFFRLWKSMARVKKYG